MEPQQPFIRDPDGNVITIEMIYDDYFDAILAYVINRVGCVATAEDITSQTFFKALRKLGSFKWTGVPISAWLYRIATNEVNSMLRTRQRRPHSSIEDTMEFPAAHFSPEDELREAQTDLEKNHVFLMLNDVIKELKPLDQTLVVLRFLEHKPFAEIAEIVGKREGAVTMRTHRALKKLQTHLEKRGITHETIRGSFEEPVQATYQGGNFQAKFAP